MSTEPNGGTDFGPDDQLLDDVEAHGLKEVAAGIGVAAVLGGAGAGAALAASTSTTPPAPVTHKVVSEVQQGATQVGHSLTPTRPPPPNPATFDNTRKPTGTVPKVHLPHRNNAQVDAPVGRPVTAAAHAADTATTTVKAAAAKAADEIRHPPLWPGTGPVL